MDDHAPRSTSSPSPSIEVTASPDPADEAFVVAQTRAFNEAFVDRDHLPLCVFVRDDAGRIVGGLTGRSYWGFLDIAFLWVDASRRGSGLATQVMQAAEDEARRRGCSHVLLDTFSFQAPAFYQRLGYVEFGRLPGFSRGHERHYLTKCLDPSAAGAAAGAGAPGPMVLQFHDSEVAGVDVDDACGAVRVRFAAAHVRRGGAEGYARTLELVLGGATCRGERGAAIGRLSSGAVLQAAGRRHERLPVPGVLGAGLVLQLAFANGSALDIEAATLRARFAGEPDFRESLAC